MYTAQTAIYQIEQIREFERIAQDRFAIVGMMLMQRAGQAAFNFLLKRWPHSQKIAVFCGGGNNGGDGYVLATLAHEHRLQVTVWQVGDHSHVREEAQNALAVCKKAGVSIKIFNEAENLQSPDLIVDAICGIGLHDTLREDIIVAIKKMAQIEAPIFSIDTPTGIDADTGEMLGAAVRATATITFIGLKLGLLTGHGIAHTGELICDDLQLPKELFAGISPIAERMQLSAYATYLKPRSRDWHKGLSGHVLIIGGDYGYFGAPHMAAEAALRVGAGLVSVATRRENASILSSSFPEVMCHAIATAKDLEPLLAKADVIVIGPGLGQSDWSKEMWECISANDLPKVVDADGLNLLAKVDRRRDDWVLTPHPGEAARLLNQTVQAVQHDRLAAIKSIGERYGGACVLKGAGSLVLAPNSLPALCDKGNPGMASAGMGDVLSGVIGGLLAQKIPLGDAAKLGVCLHAMAGDLAASKDERGLIATDLMPHLRHLVNYSGRDEE